MAPVPDLSLADGEVPRVDEEGVESTEGDSLPALGPLTLRTREPNFFDLPNLRSNSAAFPPSPRNPFLFLDEQRSGRMWSELASDPSQDVPEAAEVGPSAKDSESTALAAARRTIAAFELSAVLVARDGGSAIVNGEVVPIGERVKETDIVLAEVSSRGVVFSVEGVRVELALPEPTSRRRNRPDPERSDDAPSDDEEENS